MSVTLEQWAQMNECFDSSSVDDDTTCQVINELFNKNSVLVDPHTAVGVQSGRDFGKFSFSYCHAGDGSPS